MQACNKDMNSVKAVVDHNNSGNHQKASMIGFNTLFSEFLLFEEKINESFCLENPSSLTHEFLYENFGKKIYNVLRSKSVNIKFIKY